MWSSLRAEQQVEETAFKHTITSVYCDVQSASSFKACAWITLSNLKPFKYKMSISAFYVIIESKLISGRNALV